MPAHPRGLKFSSQRIRLVFTTWSGTREHLLFKDSGGFVLVPGPRGHRRKSLTLNLDTTPFPTPDIVHYFLFICSAGSLGQTGSSSKPLNV